MEGKFTIRFSPVKGESLSGYLMRLSAENKTHVNEVTGLMRKGFKRFNEANSKYLIDCLIEKSDEIVWAQITEQNIEGLKALTFMPLYKKFASNPSILYPNPQASIFNYDFDTQHRRFCPICLKESGIYKLIWQIKDIEICPVHGVPLTMSCPTCGAKQRYVSDELGYYRCCKCHTSLFDNITTSSVDPRYQKSQQHIYNQWEYMLSDKTPGLTPIKEMNYEVQMALTLLHLSQKMHSISLKLLDKYDKYKILRFIKDRDKLLFVKPYTIMKYSTPSSFTVKDFFKTNISRESMEELLEQSEIDRKHLVSCKVVNKENRKKVMRAPNSIQSQSLIDGVDAYLRQRNNNGLLTTREILLHKGWPYSILPTDVLEYIRGTVCEYNESYKNSLLEIIKEETILIIERGEDPTYKRVAERVGVHISWIKRTPEAGNIIKTLKIQADKIHSCVDIPKTHGLEC